MAAESLSGPAPAPHPELAGILKIIEGQVLHELTMLRAGGLTALELEKVQAVFERGRALLSVCCCVASELARGEPHPNCPVHRRPVHLPAQSKEQRDNAVVLRELAVTARGQAQALIDEINRVIERAERAVRLVPVKHEDNAEAREP